MLLYIVKLEILTGYLQFIKFIQMMKTQKLKHNALRMRIITIYKRSQYIGGYFKFYLVFFAHLIFDNSITKSKKVLKSILFF